MSWQDYAACQGYDPELWFPVTEVGPGADQTRQAKAVCASCPVRSECLRWAQDAGVTDGVFGGLTADERVAMRRQLRRMVPSQR
jgi:WhiB family redox-sensing transcriptional regulator